MHWSASAACCDADPADFHPESSYGTRMVRAAYVRARAICAECPVTAQCLAEAMRCEAGPRMFRSGMYGGLSPDERAELARRARVA